jgi:hypothetical protein
MWSSAPASSRQRLRHPPASPVDVATFSKALRSSPMADRGVTPIERLARQVCKLLLREETALSLAILQEQLGQGDPERHRVSGAWRRKSGPKPGDFDKALALAVSNGWLLQDEQGARLTTEGAALARKSRAGRRRSRHVV